MKRGGHWAKGRRPKSGTMNKTEAAYDAHLRAQLGTTVLWFAFEAMTLKLAPDTRYTPDFVVMLADGTIELHEVKGYFADDAKVKVKVAAYKFPFRFVLVRAKAKKDGGGWDIEEVG